MSMQAWNGHNLGGPSAPSGLGVTRRRENVLASTFKDILNLVLTNVYLQVHSEPYPGVFAQFVEVLRCSSTDKELFHENAAW